MTTEQLTSVFKKRRASIVVATVITLAIVFVVTILYLSVSNGKTFYNYFQEALPASNEGVIYFSARINDVGYLPTLFTLDVREGEVFVPESDSVSSAIKNTENISPNQHRTVYSEANFIIKDNQYFLPNTSQLVVFDARDDSYNTITNSNTYKTTPEWSPSGNLIAFASRDLAKKTPVENFNSWQIKTTDLSGNETFLTNGFQPKWFPDEAHLLLLRGGGLYVFNRNGGKETKLSGIEEVTVFPDTRIDLSRDGSKIILSDGEKGTYLIKLLSLEDGEAEVSQRFAGINLWPTFSEEGDEVAVFEVVPSLFGGKPEVNLSILSLETGKIKDIYNMTKFDLNSIAITDWRKK